MKLLGALALATTVAAKKAAKWEINNAVNEVTKSFGVLSQGAPSLGSAGDAIVKALKLEGNTPEGLEQSVVKAVQSGAISLEALQGYGCWCFFGNIDSALGRGPPIDQYDATCQKLSLCYRCIFVDAENEGDDECDPFNTSFQAEIDINALLGGGGINNASVACIQENQDACSWRTCSCAMTMITSFFNLSFDSNNVYDDNMKHSNGFDYALECPQQGKSLDRQCCGWYPDRRTYDRGEARACCHERSIYNPMRHVCCPDGTHLGLGHSC